MSAQPILLADHLSWEDARRIKELALPWVEDLLTFQEPWTPGDLPHMNHCHIHDLFYGGCSGCHVCNDFYVP